ncbi:MULTISPECIES: TetR/AcrR family transcriptional regulator [Anoxybacillaceae]|uniref:TetR/AcrR family transcriptional regulator n=1 Tax=Anoxybacillaceae TaxID=3120669 RepID=UPI0013180DF6|nr:MULTISPECIES: TetR/AcrR family transcriptional regulator [Anoxybacillus]MBS2772231.1 TetR/AcrR family transcriptional regulator [Anoxybacillus rupiensis]QHC05290.1 TetR family transcriptional regulator [Anoxybacillus sp. PDR2]
MENRDVMNNKDKLMQAAIDLIAERGYHGVTTQEIAAAAGLSEKTLFRHFGSKQNLLESAFDRYHYAAEMNDLFQGGLNGDLYEDLLRISRAYHEIMFRNRKMIKISIAEGHHLPGFRERTHQHPQQLKKLLIDYFTEMEKRGKVIHTDHEQTAVSFMLMHFGAFMNYIDATDTTVLNVSLEQMIQHSVQLWTRALSP